jgi:hypothetical protein
VKSATFVAMVALLNQSVILLGVLVKLREFVLPRWDLIVKEYLPTACH